ncbi:RAB, putative [Entamoeba invadens IP1]|uniref:RAB, putative n=1 Tax=Entamoeba invadens IP1 TaxID=370355 RepID=UPI0002C3EED8|nr:RAB, putative [Entamoeba invadens IP1]ELP85090.1 RAB, putative [Entamoeba invadens IP1]|eukprot:XP_004184436.1 RAB, putative [Entamoeba invadens IP1]
MEKYVPKLCLLGNASVGKSCLIDRLVKGTFSDEVHSTVSCNYVKRTFIVNGIVQDVSIWDTAGQEKYRSISEMYYRGSAGALVVFDVTDTKSFDSLKRWFNELKNVSPKCEVLLVGNKIDLDTERQITTQMAESFARDHLCEYCEVSAKTGKRVVETFEKIVLKIAKTKKAIAEPGVVSINKTSSCC